MVYQPRPVTTPKSAVGLLLCLIVGGCGKMADPYADWPMRPAGHAGETQFIEEATTGCLYWAPTGETAKAGDIHPLLRPDGSQMGCRSPAGGASSASTTDASKATGTTPNPNPTEKT